jgi:hypothetical protein
MPSSSHALSALLSFLGWALFWVLVCPGLWESIACFFISNFCRVQYVVCFLLGNSPGVWILYADVS